MKKILVLCDDRHHPGDIVMPGLSPLSDEYILNFVFHAGCFDPSTIDRYSAVILAKGNCVSGTDFTPWLTLASRAVLRGFVELRGGGLLVIHSGLTGLDGLKDHVDLVGACFTHHPAQCDTTFTPLKPHPVVDGVEAFTVTDEHYFLADVAPDADVFLASSSIHGVQPAGYALRRGRGRVCAYTPGHTIETWLHATAQLLIRNALKWVAKPY